MVSESLVLATALRLVGLAGLMVPRALRDDWKREWRAELWHLHRSVEERSIREDSAFVLRSLGSVLDALQLRAGDAQTWSESASAVVGRWARHSPSVTVALLFLSIGIAADALLLAFGRVALAIPLSAWPGVVAEGRPLILGVALSCGVGMIVASAAAAAQLLGAGEGANRGDASARVVETLLIAGVTAWLARWLVVFGMRTLTLPESSWLAAAELGAAATSAWLVSWLLGLTLLVLVRSRHHRPARIGR
jgi:hypothetical protein